MRFALSPNDPRIAILVVELDHDDVPIAHTWRAVAGAAERLGLARPSYQHVRRLVRIERRRRQLEARGRAVLGRAATTLAAGRVPSAVLDLEQLRDLRRAEGLVLQEHKAFRPPSGSAGARGLTAPGRRSRGPSAPRPPR